MAKPEELPWPNLQRIDGVGWGRCCLKDSGIGVFFLAGRFMAGESIASIADDYERTPDEVEDAIRLFLCSLRGQQGERVETRMAAILKATGRDLSGAAVIALPGPVVTADLTPR